MERRSPLYDYHLRTSAQMIKGGGDFMFPAQYTSAAEEHLNTRANAGMQDLSSMGEVDIKGPGAERLLHRLLVNEVKDLVPGQVRYSTLVNEQGGVIDDITIYKFSDEHFMLITSSGPRKKTVRWIAEHADTHAAYITDITASIALPVVQGPRSRDFLKSVVKEADLLQKLKFFRFMRATINDTEVILSRSGYTGELGYELYTPAEEAGSLWEYLLREGRNFGLLPYGVLAMQSLRMEKGLPLYGPDISEEVTPFHLGLDKWIKFEKRDFIGREALLRVQERGIMERWAGLIVDSEVPLKMGDRLYAVADMAVFKDYVETGPEAGQPEDAVKAGMQEVGRVTSSYRGHSMGKMLAVAYLRTSHSFPGARLAAIVNGRAKLCTVATMPFFDPENARLRG
ncbi:MAG: aminomethyltransferase family protein [Anaerolineales bacterium]